MIALREKGTQRVSRRQAEKRAASPFLLQKILPKDVTDHKDSSGRIALRIDARDVEAKTVRATLYDPDRPASQRHLTGTIFLSPGGRQEIHFPGSLEQSKKKRPIPGPAARPSPPPPETWDLINTPLSFALTVAPDALYLESDATAGAFDITNWYYSARLQPSKDVPLPAKKP